MTENRCFISAPAGADLHVLIGVLTEYGYSVHAPDTFVPGEHWIDTLRRDLANADLVIGVFQSNLPTSNVSFELGLASGLAKRVIVITPPEVDIPQALSAFLVVRADPTNQEAIAFALEQIAAAPKLRAQHGRAIRQPVKLQPVEIDNYVRRMRSAQREMQIIEALHQLLIAAGADIVVQEPHLGKGMRPDLAIWSDALGPYVGNPLLIEVQRKFLGLSAFKGTLERIQRYIHLAGAMWAIFLYMDGPDLETAEIHTRMTPNIIAMPMYTFVERLRSESLFDVVRTLRNKRVHGVEG